MKPRQHSADTLQTKLFNLLKMDVDDYSDEAGYVTVPNTNETERAQGET